MVIIVIVNSNVYEVGKIEGFVHETIHLVNDFNRFVSSNLKGETHMVFSDVTVFRINLVGEIGGELLVIGISESTEKVSVVKIKKDVKADVI